MITLTQASLFLLLILLLIAREIEQRADARASAERIRDLKASNEALNAMLDRYQYNRPPRSRQDGGQL